MRNDQYGWSLDRDKQNIIKRSLDNNLGRATFYRQRLRQVQLETGDCIFRSTDSSFSSPANSVIRDVKNIQQFKDVHNLDEGILPKPKVAILKPPSVLMTSVDKVEKRLGSESRYRLTNCTKFASERRKAAKGDDSSKSGRLAKTTFQGSLSKLRIRNNQDPLHRDIVTKTRKIRIDEAFKTFIYGFTVKRKPDPNLANIQLLLQPADDLIMKSRAINAARRARHQKEEEEEAQEYLSTNYDY